MADITWPLNVPLPLVDQSVAWNNPTLSGDPQNGPPTIKHWTDDQAYTFDVVWNLTSQEWVDFQEFVYTTALNSAKWFNIDLNLFHDSQGQLTECEVNFANNQPQNSQVDGRQVVTATLTVRNVKELRDNESLYDDLIDLVDGGYNNLPALTDRLEVFSNSDLLGFDEVNRTVTP